MSIERFWDWMIDMTTNKVCSVTFTGEYSINYDLFREVFGFNKPNNTYDCEIYEEKKIPNRKHKKKRIAKKWLKRYGYQTIQAKSDWKLSEYKNYNGINKFTLVKS